MTVDANTIQFLQDICQIVIGAVQDGSICQIVIGAVHDGIEMLVVRFLGWI